MAACRGALPLGVDRDQCQCFLAGFIFDKGSRLSTYGWGGTGSLYKAPTVYVLFCLATHGALLCLRRANRDRCGCFEICTDVANSGLWTLLSCTCLPSLLCTAYQRGKVICVACLHGVCISSWKDRHALLQGGGCLVLDTLSRGELGSELG